MLDLIRSRSLSVLIGLLLLTMAGCNRNKNLTRTNYDKIASGMTLGEVEKLLGGPGEQEGGDLAMAEGSGGAGAAGIGGDLDSMSRPRSTDKSYKWGTDARWIKVTFRDDKVTGGTFKTEQGLK
jgi:hypothetical protein